MNQDDSLKRITSRPDVFGGKPIIRDLRISVEWVLSLLAQGESIESILDDYPGLDQADINACLAYAHAVVAHDRIDRIAITPDGWHRARITKDGRGSSAALA